MLLWSPAVLIAVGLVLWALAPFSLGSCGHAPETLSGHPEPWTTTPSLFPHPASHRDTPAASLVLTTQGEVWFDGECLGEGASAVTVAALKMANEARGARWVVLRTPELPPAEVMRWLRAIKAAGFDGVGFWVNGPTRGEAGATIAEERFYRFAQDSDPPAWIEVLLGPRRAAVVRADQPPAEARNGAELFAALGKAVSALDWGKEGCAVARVLAPISTEHLLNGLAVTGSVYPGMDKAPAPKDRAALIEAMWAVKTDQARCVVLALGRG